MTFPVIPMLFRARAREVLKKNLSTALMVSFLAALPGLLSQVFQSIASKDLLEMVRYHMLTLADAIQAGATDAALLQMLNNGVVEMQTAITPMLELSWVLSLVATVVLAPVLSLGVMVHLLKLVRGQAGEVTDVISRVGIVLQAIWQSILVAVKALLWTLPGMAVSIAAMVVFFLTNGQLGFMLTLYTAGVVLGMVLMIRAMLHYSMSAIILADEPSAGPYGSIKRSIAMMRNHKMDFVRVYISFIFWNIGASWVSNILGVMIPVLGTMSSLAFQLALGLYVNTTIVVFYLNLKGEISMVPKNGGFAELEELLKQERSNSSSDDDDDNDDDMLN